MRTLIIKLLIVLTVLSAAFQGDAQAYTNGAYVIFSTRLMTQATNNPRINISFSGAYTNGLFVGTNIITAKPIPIQPSNGVSTNFLTSAYYKVSIEGDPYTFLMGVPADGGTYNAISLITNTPISIPGFGLLYPGAYITITTNTTNGFLSYTINSTGGGGGGTPILGSANIAITLTNGSNQISASGLQIGSANLTNWSALGTNQFTQTNDTRAVNLTNAANVFAGNHSGNGSNLTNLVLWVNLVPTNATFDNGAGPMGVTAYQMPVLPTNQFYFVQFLSTNSNGENLGFVGGGGPTAISQITPASYSGYASGLFSLYGVTQPIYIYNVDNPPTAGTAVTTRIYAVQTNIGYWINSNSYVQDAALSQNVQLLYNPLKEFAGSNTARGHDLWSSNSQNGSTLNLVASGTSGYSDIGFFTGGTYPSTLGNVLRFAIGVGVQGTNQFPYNNPYWELYGGTSADFVQYGRGVFARVNGTNGNFELFNGTAADGDYSKIYFQTITTNGSLILGGLTTNKSPSAALLGANSKVGLWTSNGVLYAASSTDGTTLTQVPVSVASGGGGGSITNVPNVWSQSNQWTAQSNTFLNGLNAGSFLVTTNGTILGALAVTSNSVFSANILSASHTNTGAINTSSLAVSNTGTFGAVTVTNALTANTETANTLTISNTATFKSNAIFSASAGTAISVPNGGTTSLDQGFITTDGLGDITTSGKILSTLAGTTNAISFGSGASNGLYFPTTTNFGFSANGTNALLWVSNALYISAPSVYAAGVLLGSGGGSPITNNVNWWSQSNYWSSATNYFTNTVLAGGFVANTNFISIGTSTTTSNVNFGTATNQGVWMPAIDNWVFGFNNTNAGAYTNKGWVLTNLVVQNITINGTQTGGSGSITNVTNVWSASNQWTAQSNSFINGVNFGSINVASNGVVRGALTVTSNSTFSGGLNVVTNVLITTAGSISNVQLGSVTNNGIWFPAVDSFVFSGNGTNALQYTNKAWNVTGLNVTGTNTFSGTHIIGTNSAATNGFAVNTLGSLTNGQAALVNSNGFLFLTTSMPGNASLINTNNYIGTNGVIYGNGGGLTNLAGGGFTTQVASVLPSGNTSFHPFEDYSGNQQVSASNICYFSYIGQTVSNIVLSRAIVRYYTSGTPLASNTIEIGIFSSPNPPNFAAQTLTKICATNAVLNVSVGWTNSAAFTNVIAAGTHIYLGFKAQYYSVFPGFYGTQYDLETVGYVCTGNYLGTFAGTNTITTTLSGYGTYGPWGYLMTF